VETKVETLELAIRHFREVALPAERHLAEADCQVREAKLQHAGIWGDGNARRVANLEEYARRLSAKLELTTEEGMEAVAVVKAEVTRLRQRLGEVGDLFGDMTDASEKRFMHAEELVEYILGNAVEMGISVERLGLGVVEGRKGVTQYVKNPRLLPPSAMPVLTAENIGPPKTTAQENCKSLCSLSAMEVNDFFEKECEDEGMVGVGDPRMDGEWAAGMEEWNGFAGRPDALKSSEAATEFERHCPYID
jgi:hypothetical protein